MNEEWTDEEIFDDPSFFEELGERKRNLQCYWCSGWYMDCSCDLENDSVKRAYHRYLELTSES